MTVTWRDFDIASAASGIFVPGETDDKYSRGVLGIATGSKQYPGAAILGTDAAARTGVGMIRYVGPKRAEDLILARRPEAVFGFGRVQAWLIGSGIGSLDDDQARAAEVRRAAADDVPLVLDAGALPLVHGARRAFVTPHAGEMASLVTTLGEKRDREWVEEHPREAAERVARQTGACVVLKGATTRVLAGETGYELRGAPGWLATAGAGDVLAGILGAIVATHADDAEGDRAARLAATAVTIHSLAAVLASDGGPITALDTAEAIPHVIRALLDGDA